MCSCKTELDLLARPEVQDELSKIKVVIKRGFPAAGPPLPVLREIDDITKIELHLDDVERTPLFSRPGIICNTYDCPKDRLHEERNALTISFNNTNDDSSSSEDTHVRKVLCASKPRSEEYRQHNRNDLYEKDKTDKPSRRSLTRASCSSRIKRRSRSRSPRRERSRSRDCYRRSRSRSSRRERSRSRERHAVSNKRMGQSRSSRSTRSRSRSRERQYYVPHHIPPTHMPGFFSYPRMPYGYRFPGPGIYAYPPMHIPFVPRYPNYGLPMTNRNSMPNGVDRNSRRSEQVHKENIELTD